MDEWGGMVGGGVGMDVEKAKVACAALSSSCPLRLRPSEGPGHRRSADQGRLSSKDTISLKIFLLWVDFSLVLDWYAEDLHLTHSVISLEVATSGKLASIERMAALKEWTEM